MKKLMLTTALVAATSVGAFAQTEITAPATDMEMIQTGANVPAFLVSTFTGKSLYTLDSDDVRGLDETRMTDESVRWESGATFSASRDNWDNVGNIDDVVLTQDGELRGVLLDVGGFLGLGARTVLVDLEELYFVADDQAATELNDFSVVATLTREELESLPEWDEAQLTTGFEARSHSNAATAPMRDAAMSEGNNDVFAGYAPMASDELTADRIIGANVYGLNGENIATIDDLVLGADDEITQAVMDVGGFLGMGTYTVAIDIAEINVMTHTENDEVRAQISMTQAELEALPEYQN